MKTKAIRHLVKTNPIQTQTNPISEKPKLNVNSIVTKDYENICPCGAPKNKPNSKPILQECKMSATIWPTRNYQNHPLQRIRENKPKQSQFQRRERVKPRNHKNENRYSADLKRASSLNTRFIGRLRTSELSSDRDVRICSRIDSILSVSLAIMVNQMLKLSLRR